MKTARYLITGSLILCFVLSFNETYGASSARTVRQDTNASLYWVHKDTGRKIFGLEDIVAFDWDKQMFQLKEDAAMTMRLYPVGLIDPFEVRLGKQVIYEGAFISMKCSMTYQGPVISDTYHYSETYSSIFQIINGYPDTKYSVDYSHYTKPLKQIFSEAGLIKVINPNDPPSPIHCKYYDWLGEKSGLRVWLDVFTDTFAAEKIARFHFRLNSPRQYPDGDYVIETQTTLTANDGRYIQTVRRVFPVSKKYLWAAHPVGFFLSAIVKGDTHEHIETGPAQLAMEIAIRRVLDKKQGLYSEPIETLKTEPVALEIKSTGRNGLNVSSSPKIEQTEAEKERLKSERQEAQKREQLLRQSLKAMLVPVQDEYVIGKPMLFSLEVNNISDSVVTLPYFSTAVMVNYPLSVKDSDGKDVIYIGGSCQTGEREKDFEPGQTTLLASNYDATTQYLITTAGKYTVQFRGQYQIPPSEIVTINVKPGQLNLREQITLKLLSIRPVDWTLYGATPISSKSTNTTTHLNLIAALGIGSFEGCFLRIYIDPDEYVMADFGKSVFAERLGQSEWGPVYITETITDLFWPDCRESLIRALNLQE